MQELGASFVEEAIPEEYAEQAAEYREKLLEMVVELEDETLEKYFEVRGCCCCLGV